MKKLSFVLLSIFLLLGTTRVWAQQQQEELSDFEIQKNFKAQYQEFKNKVDTVAVADSAQAILEDVASFDQEYQSHKELLNKALYPDTYSQVIEELNQAATLAANRLQKMEQQDDQLTTLQLRLLAYQEHVFQLTQEADSLKQAMQESIESEKQLSGMVRNYRRNLEQRDELVLAFIDSTVVAYQQMDLQAIRELEKMNAKARIDSDGDALKMIRDIAAENVTILEENSSKLRLEDYMRMQTVQQRFEEMWNRLGNKIAEVYGGSDSEEIASEVDSRISEWDQMLQEKTFATLNDSLSEQGLAVGSFKNAEEFKNSLNSYLDSAIKESKSDASQENYEHYQTFQDFWNRVERQWSSHFTNAELMTSAELATISEKTDQWAQYAEPESNTMTYLLILAVFVVLVLGGLLVREKTKSNKDRENEAS
ncbi:hypothetical protein [Fodinibius sediminis]|uniref:LPXTG-motif cell wall anchor domain-containing protein n=1 Tax=Fodinibius sediminis TaxID=1214077 RepID=A0A521F2K5_9BACT|nr:hypothetical protein [Fodinibius sediminis]SMO90432.1 hypothetical protein SAMN06265218_12219 [Fodinibius sediminis]